MDRAIHMRKILFIGACVLGGLLAIVAEVDDVATKDEVAKSLKHGNSLISKLRG